MKKLLFALCFGLAASITYGQDITSEINFYQSAYGLEKKGIVENFMNLSGEKATAFWEVYNAYETERKEIGKNRIANLNTYADVYENMTDEQADDITGKMLSNRASQEKLYKKYYGKMKKVVGAKTALQFLELEVYLQTAISYAILESIPFVGEQ
jgi:hypothetical protein